MPDAVIDAQGVSKIYTSQEGPVRALDDVSLTLRPGEFVSLLGPSGCGKSTFLMLVSGLIPQSGGSIRVHGREVAGPVTDLGFVFQSPTLLEWRTAIGNVMLQAEARNLSRKESERVARSLFRSIGLEGFERHRPSELSGGMMQRVAICRALLHNPDLLLMDEPFGSVDDQTRMLLQEELLTIWERDQKTVVFVTHDIEEALYLGDKVVIMRARPSQISRIIDVPFGRPRAEEVRGSPEMARLKQEIWDELKSGATVEG